MAIRSLLEKLTSDEVGRLIERLEPDTLMLMRPEDLAQLMIE